MNKTSQIIQHRHQMILIMINEAELMVDSGLVQNKGSTYIYRLYFVTAKQQVGTVGHTPIC